MKVIRHRDASFSAQLQAATNASSLFDAEVEQRTHAILRQVREKGDAALLELTSRFDGATLSADQLPMTQAELMTAYLQVSPELKEAVSEAAKNIAFFSLKSRRRDWSARNSHGALVGEKFDPFQRVGIYIPGGTAPLVSTALMTVVL